MATADAHLVSLADSELFHMTVPSKISSLLAAGVPILGVIGGDAARLLTASGAAVLAAPGQPESIASAIEQAVKMSQSELKRMGRSGRAYYDEHFSAASVAAAILSSLRAGDGRSAGWRDIPPK
jgi:glycosyltransferase involved in cell wall biosynthesis